ncbi:MAG: ATP-binding protein [Anaerolineaceae bacterium]|nr:ATP-binding protein [Anaerolineaceae bacterium]
MEVFDKGNNRIRVPADRKYLSTIRDFIYEQAKSVGAAPAEVDNIIQAVDEAVANIIIHGYMDGPGEIIIEVNGAPPDSISVSISDKAPFFDPTKAPEVNINLPLEQRPVGGLGIHIIRNCIDEISHSVSPEGENILVLKKNLRRKTN